MTVTSPLMKLNNGVEMPALRVQGDEPDTSAVSSSARA